MQNIVQYILKCKILCIIFALYNETIKTMGKDTKRKRSSANAVILKQLAIKYNVTEQYARVCSKGHSDSDVAEKIQADYKLAEQKLKNLV